MTSDTPSRPPEGHEHVEQLLRDLCELADQTAAQIADAAVDTQLERILKNAGRSGHPRPGPYQETAPDTGYPLNAEYLPVHEVEESLTDLAAVPGIGADPFTDQMAHSGKDRASTEDLA
jgi:hypothetical protein